MIFFRKKHKETSFRLQRIFMQCLVVGFVIIFMYFYMPLAKNIYVSLSHIFEGPSQTNTIIINDLSPLERFESGNSFGLTDDLGQHFIGLLLSLFVFVMPVGLIILFVWKAIVNLNSYGRTKRKYKRLDQETSAKISNSEKKISMDFYSTFTEFKELFEMGKKSYTAGNYNEAINRFSQAINVHSNCKAFFNRGLLYYRIGDRDQALKDFKEAARLGHEKSQNILMSNRITWKNEGSINNKILYDFIVRC